MCVLDIHTTHTSNSHLTMSSWRSHKVESPCTPLVKRNDVQNEMYSARKKRCPPTLLTYQCSLLNSASMSEDSCWSRPCCYHSSALRLHACGYTSTQTDLVIASLLRFADSYVGNVLQRRQHRKPPSVFHDEGQGTSGMEGAKRHTNWLLTHQGDTGGAQGRADQGREAYVENMGSLAMPFTMRRRSDDAILKFR